MKASARGGGKSVAAYGIVRLRELPAQPTSITDRRFGSKAIRSQEQKTTKSRTAGQEMAQATARTKSAISAVPSIPTAAVGIDEHQLTIDVAPWRGPAPEFYPSADHTPADRERLSEILPARLYLTNWRGAINESEKQRLGITHIAAIGAEFASDADAHPGLNFLTMDITDDDDQRFKMALGLREGASFIHKAIECGGKVLVHCAAGVSRSTTLILAYLMIHEKYTLREAFARVHQCRPFIWPNNGFMIALIAIEREERGGSATICALEYDTWGAWEGPAVQKTSEQDAEPKKHVAVPPRMRRQTTNLANEMAEAHKFGLI